MGKFRFHEPVTKISAVVMGKPVTLEFSKQKRICTVLLKPTVTKAAVAGVRSVPQPADAFGEMRFNIDGTTNRKRTAAQLFGATGLNALNQAGNGGTVVYTQAGNATLSVVPVVIGSADDLAQQALLTINTITVAQFQLPIVFCEDFRKTILGGERFGLVTGFDNGKNVGPVILEIDVANNANITSVAVDASYEYDEVVAKAGSTIYLSKEKIFNKQYAAAGDIEVGDQLSIPNGEALQRLSLLTAADRITKVVVKQGNRILRNISDTDNQAYNRKAGLNGGAFVSNRFDIEFDINDDETSAVSVDGNQEISVVVTLATANDAVKNITLLPSYYGPKE